ncbi:MULTISPECIES: AraC family transcriptional regulator [Catenuloplanes]|uniref:AraC family L-rhamnose operon transcriptional activator RhaR n=1 Tax=Catenuloplanes niger TaxID=587534 RepID=A0AAE3ZVY9_9ACTN|nr:AraC family transcriptional regulator [Catenuloplanes niger]MDR7327003.1 AraC family L-rhamnose operon transcriptional activator RhaR [Catenuloplanes niger]
MSAPPPVDNTRSMLHFIDGSVAYAGHYLHEGVHETHTHSFVEIAVVVGGSGTHHSLSGRRRLEVGDAILLRPGVWHGYEECRGLDLYNCCFSTELLQRELAWMRGDPMLGYLLWTGPYSDRRRGILTTRLTGDALAESLTHLDALDRLRALPVALHRGDIIGRLALFLSHLARSVFDVGAAPGRTHPAVTRAMHLLEERPAYAWSLTALADALHLTPGHLVRVFKTATGLPPMAYLNRHRVEIAADRLLHTDTPIGRIGELVGWPDPNYFARRFRAHYGMSASAYRARFTHRVAKLRTFTGIDA